MEIQTNLPLTETTLYILLSLIAQPKHGYTIMKEVEALSEGRVVLSTGTLYGAIKRLLEQGWIERYEDEGGPEDGRGRKVYRLTVTGQRILEAETARLSRLIATARQQLERVAT